MKAVCKNCLNKICYVKTKLIKSTRIKFNNSTHTIVKQLGYVHSDLWGLARAQTHGGGRYFLFVVDDYSRKLCVFILKTKDKAFERFKD